MTFSKSVPYNIILKGPIILSYYRIIILFGKLQQKSK